MIQSTKMRPAQSAVDLSTKALAEITNALRPLLADVFSLYRKTKDLRWHMTRRHFRDYHRLLDQHADQNYAMTGDIAERRRKIGGTTLPSMVASASLIGTWIDQSERRTWFLTETVSEL